VLNIT